MAKELKSKKKKSKEIVEEPKAKKKTKKKAERPRGYCLTCQEPQFLNNSYVEELISGRKMRYGVCAKCNRNVSVTVKSDTPADRKQTPKEAAIRKENREKRKKKNLQTVRAIEGRTLGDDEPSVSKKKKKKVVEEEPVLKKKKKKKVLADPEPVAKKKKKKAKK